MNWTSVVRNCKQSCVLVQITGRDSLSKKGIGLPSSKSENGITTLSGSGVIVSSEKNLIVTSGSIVYPFLVQDDSTNLPKDNHTLLPGTTLSILTSGGDATVESSWINCELVGVWGCESVARCIHKLNAEFQYNLETGWGDLSGKDSGARNDNRGIITMDFIAIIRCNSNSIPLFPATFSDSSKLELGQPVAVIGSPFGCISPTSFLNSVSTGVISHSFHGPKGSADLVLTDARCLPGNEGGGVFDINGHLIGLIAPHSNIADKPLDLNFVVPINPIAALLNNIIGRTQSLSEHDTLVPENVYRAKRSVVTLQIGNSWASGIVVSNEGHILTNAHLFKACIPELSRATPIPTHEYENLTVKIYFNKVQNHTQLTNKPSVGLIKCCVTARVIYLSHTHLDVALLQIEGGEEKQMMRQSLQPIKASLSVETSIGMPVWLIAHGFAPEQGMDTICSYGTVANVIMREGVPASLQTSATVHSGNSGGALINSVGELVGMVMSNTTLRNSRTFTRLNFAIPYQQLITLINYANGEDQRAIERLHRLPTDTFLASLWKFQPEPSDRPKVGPSFRDFVDKMKLPDRLTTLNSLPKSKL